MLSMQSDKRQTITPDDFRHLAKDFGVTLPEEFLYENNDPRDTQRILESLHI